MTKLVCECGEVIEGFSVTTQDMGYRTDYELDSIHGKLFRREDREYFRGFVHHIIYKCNCATNKHKEKVVEMEDDDRNILDDFMRDVDEGNIFGLDENLKQKKYGSIIVVKC